MSKHYNKERIGEIVAKIKELGLSYAEGAKEFNIPIRHLYRYNNEIQRENESAIAGSGVSQLDSRFDKGGPPAKGTRWFGASGPLELFQMNVSYVYVTGSAVCYLILIIDDYSRFVVGHELVFDQKSLIMIIKGHFPLK